MNSAKKWLLVVGLVSIALIAPYVLAVDIKYGQNNVTANENLWYSWDSKGVFTEVNFSQANVTIKNLNASKINTILYVQTGNASDIQAKVNKGGASHFKLVIPNGTYSNVHINVSAYRVEIEGVGHPVLDGGGTGCILNLSGSYEIEVRNIDFKNADIGICIDKITDAPHTFVIKGNSFSNLNYAIRAQQLHTSDIRDNRFYNATILLLEGGHAVSISGNWFQNPPDNNFAVNITSDTIYITQNTFSGCFTECYGIGLNPRSSAYIVGNHFEQITTGIIVGRETTYGLTNWYKTVYTAANMFTTVNTSILVGVGINADATVYSFGNIFAGTTNYSIVKNLGTGTIFMVPYDVSKVIDPNGRVLGMNSTTIVMYADDGATIRKLKINATSGEVYTTT